MSDNQSMLIVILAELINFTILYVLVAAESSQKKRALYDWTQTELLVKMARQQGIPEKEIDE